MQELPKVVYNGQVIEVNLKALIAIEDIQEISTSYENYTNINILTQKPLWIKENDNIYTCKIYMQLKDLSVKLPDILVNVTTGSNTLNSEMYVGKKIKTQAISQSDKFCSVLAQSFDIVNFQSTQYDKDYNLLGLQINATNANLYQFYINNRYIVEQGIKKNDIIYPISGLIYYFIIDKSIKVLEFEFFNLETLKMEKRVIPIRLDEERVSTQTDLKPKSNFNQLYKILLLLSLIVGLGFIYMLKRKKIYLLLLLIITIILITVLIPTRTIMIKSNTYVRILPTKNSTTFFHTIYAISGEVLNTRGKYTKVILENNKVGWVHEKDIITH